MVLKGVVRAERLEDPAFYIKEVLSKAKKIDLQRIYGIEDWQDEEDFLDLVARKKGRLLKGGEPDIKTTAKLVLIDWQRGEIPFFVPPPQEEEGNEEAKDDEDDNKEFKVPKLILKK